MLTLSQGIIMPLCERFAGCEVHGREPDVRCVACDAALHSLCLLEDSGEAWVGVDASPRPSI